MGQDFSILQKEKKAKVAALLCQALPVQDNMLIPAGQQLFESCLSLGVWPWASYLMFLSLDFLIGEMAMRMQRTWCQAAGAITGPKPGERGPGFPA